MDVLRKGNTFGELALLFLIPRRLGGVHGLKIKLLWDSIAQMFYLHGIAACNAWKLIVSRDPGDQEFLSECLVCCVPCFCMFRQQRMSAALNLLTRQNICLLSLPLISWKTKLAPA